MTFYNIVVGPNRYVYSKYFGVGHFIRKVFFSRDVKYFLGDIIRELTNYMWNKLCIVTKMKMKVEWFPHPPPSNLKGMFRKLEWAVERLRVAVWRIGVAGRSSKNTVNRAIPVRQSWQHSKGRPNDHNLFSMHSGITSKLDPPCSVIEEGWLQCNWRMAGVDFFQSHSLLGSRRANQQENWK